LTLFDVISLICFLYLFLKSLRLSVQHTPVHMSNISFDTTCFVFIFSCSSQAVTYNSISAISEFYWGSFKNLCQYSNLITKICKFSPYLLIFILVILWYVSPVSLFVMFSSKLSYYIHCFLLLYWLYLIL
jgi:hypothetical protein